MKDQESVQSEETTTVEGSQIDTSQEEDRSILRSMQELGYIDIGLDI